MDEDSEANKPECYLCTDLLTWSILTPAKEEKKNNDYKKGKQKGTIFYMQTRVGIGTFQMFMIRYNIDISLKDRYLGTHLLAVM